MLRMFARRTTFITVASNSDAVFFGISLPSGSVIHDIKCKVSVASQADVARAVGLFYAIEGWILPMLDPDGGGTFDALFDTLVPKDSDSDVLDLDTGAVDTTPFFEPGEVDWSDIVDVGLRPERIYSRKRLMSISSGNARFIFQDNQSPFAVKWIAGDTFSIHIKKRFSVRQPSIMAFALANPAMDDTTATTETALSENEWPRVKFMKDVLTLALHHVLGLTEAGAETPWVEAAALVKKHLEPDVIETVGGSFGSQAYEVFAEGIVDHSVEGEMAIGALSTGR